DVANELRDRGALDEEECFIDATFVMAKGGGAEIGATKRGKGMKIMAIVDRHGLPLSVSAHAANRLDVFFGDSGEWRGRAGPRQRNIFWIISLFIAATKTCPISSAMPKSRDVASRANTSTAGEGSGISLVRSLPRCRIVMLNLAEGAVRAAGCDTSFCSRVCAMPTEPGAGILPLTSAV